MVRTASSSSTISTVSATVLLPLYSRFEIQYDFSIKNLPEFDKGVCGMEGQKKRRPPVLLLMILVLFLTVGGLALAVQSFGRYDTLLLEQSDSQLYGLARSVDRSVSGALEQFIGELDYLIRLENFTDAEADAEELRNYYHAIKERWKNF